MVVAVEKQVFAQARALTLTLSKPRDGNVITRFAGQITVHSMSYRPTTAVFAADQAYDTAPEVSGAKPHAAFTSTGVGWLPTSSSARH